MQRLSTIAGVLGVQMLLASASSAFDAPEHPGTISGTVVSSATGAPVAGAYVGIGDFGDAGGANLERFRKQGLYAETQTDNTMAATKPAFRMALLFSALREERGPSHPTTAGTGISRNRSTGRIPADRL